MFLREVAEASDGLCIRATAYMLDDDAQSERTPVVVVDAGEMLWKVGWAGGDSIEAITEASAGWASVFGELEAIPDTRCLHTGSVLELGVLLVNDS